MKVQCGQATFEERVSMFNKKTQTKPIEGLTLGKVYEATPVSLTEGSIVSGLGDIETKVRFLIYNDNGDWDTYQPELFKPRSE